MKRLLCLLLLSAAAFAQGAFIPPQTAFRVVNGLTSPIGAATITVCGANAAGVPCAPVLNATIFKDLALTQPLSNPFTADGNGNYQFAAAIGTYTVTVSSFGFAGYSYQVSVGGVASVNPVTIALGPPGFSRRFTMIYADSGTGPVAEGTGQAPVSCLNGAGGQSGTNAAPTATEPPGRNFFSNNTATTNIQACTSQGWGASLGTDDKTFGTILQFSMRLLINNTANVRYWVGITDGATGDFAGSGLASNTPNRSYAMFRFSAGTDTNWQACTGVAGPLQTCIDTGIAPQTTSSVLFDIVPSTTNVTFYINGVLVATVSTNNPAQGDRVGVAWTADNKNTATAVGATFNSAYATLK